MNKFNVNRNGNSKYKPYFFTAVGCLQNQARADVNNRFVYVDTQMLQWQHHQGLWNLEGKKQGKIIFLFLYILILR